MNSNEILVSVIIVYNKFDEIINAKAFIEKQTIYTKIETIFLDNTNNQYSSAAKAFNFAAKTAKGKVLVFMHQDIELLDETILYNYYNYLLKHNSSIIGAAGRTIIDNKVHASILHGKEKANAGLPMQGFAMEATTLDECLFALTKQRYLDLKFDEKCCDNWHLYAADICYENILANGKNYVISTNAYHKSTGGGIDYNFEKTLGKMIIKYSGKLDRIETPCIKIDCNIWTYIKFEYKRIKRRIANKLF